MTGLLADFYPLAAIATTPQGYRCLSSLATEKEVTLWIPTHLGEKVALIATVDHIRVFEGSLADHLQRIWPQQRGIIFAMATGAIIRLIAPLLSNKHTDPAIIAMAENGDWVISLTGGHYRGGDRLARMIAAHGGAEPVLTGAANGRDYLALDCLGRPFGWRKGMGAWTALSAALARGENIAIYQESGSTLWQSTYPPDQPLDICPLPFPEELAGPSIWITHRNIQPSSSHSPIAVWHPRTLWLGIGCERGTSLRVLQQAIQKNLATAGLSEAAISGVASLDIKGDEAAILALCQENNWPLRLFRSEQLDEIRVPNPSPVVAAEVGTASVAEAAAILAADSGMLILPKQIHRLSGEPGAATLAIAQSEEEYTGRQGKLWLVGMGPGALSQLTQAARTAIIGADVLIGYGLYLDLLAPLQRPGQIMEAYAITQERERAQRAIALAEWGLTVAVISSGDAGIYGMAGLVLELLQTQGWNGQDPSVEIFPGVSALQAAAARVGTPLMHDFCAISLSDRLTPWPVIRKRLEASAQADFVVALYNPRSRDRQHQLVDAQEIFQQHRPRDTPVALVRSAYRPDETIHLTTLGDFNPESVDMFTLVLIGNASSCQYHHWFITPRGYIMQTEGAKS
ncbi:precorrin-3B C(17)-methyltransferase [Candidatus Synechococcus calcipolaris G9]|uniref:Precorrin-3B C(17)-methyltransferase n=1 Tax=Candidatus Synechococcus calcipolaris G9 TaxID=1497997 RepID=A0ABT6EW88_9SYNE|nr:precorrin-3B C(17)-methyltransferase [Candidatus Synechococcus calcipolaris]MDG2990044.1 precorrin-3B C(17)-methyltransferase [Candidatus Synechococcus calcipolaris G9]